MKRTRYRIIRSISEAAGAGKEFGLIIQNRREKIFVFPISANRGEVKNIVRRLRPHHLSPAVAKEVIEDLIYER